MNNPQVMETREWLSTLSDAGGQLLETLRLYMALNSACMNGVQSSKYISKRISLYVALYDDGLPSAALVKSPKDRSYLYMAIGDMLYFSAAHTRDLVIGVSKSKQKHVFTDTDRVPSSFTGPSTIVRGLLALLPMTASDARVGKQHFWAS